MKDFSFFVPVYRPNRLWMDEMISSMAALCRKSNLSAEILLGDDGTPDGGADFMDEYARKYPELVQTFHFPENRGIGLVSCDLVNRAQGRYVASFDQDDVLLDFDLAGEIACLEEHPEYLASYAPKYVFNGRGLTGGVDGDLPSWFKSFWNPRVNVNAMLIRRETLLEAENFKPLPFCRHNQDVWLILRLYERGDLYFSRTPRTLYRNHASQAHVAPLLDQGNWFLMGHDIASRHMDLFRRIMLSGDLPETETENELHFAVKMAGLVFFLLQNNSALMRAILFHAERRCPEDYGIREAQLDMFSQQNLQAEFQESFRRAMRDFDGNRDAMRIFTGLYEGNSLKYHLSADPGIIRMSRELHEEHARPTESVLRALSQVRPFSVPQAPLYTINIR